MASGGHIYQTLDPRARAQLDPRFCGLFDQKIQYVPPIEQSTKWHPGLRSALSGYEGMASEAVKVETIDISRGTFSVRVYRHIGRERGKLYPGFIYFPGGGGVVGQIGSDSPLCSRIALETGIVVVAVHYRLAPEHPYPNGVNNCFDAVRWIAESGEKELDIDQTRILIGGSSTGAHFAALVALKAGAHDPPIHLMMEILLVPPTIYTAARHQYRQEKAWAPGAGRIEWYQSLLFLNQDAESPEASPLLASPEQLRNLPDTWIAVAEVDPLCPEGLAFAEVARKAGVEVVVKEYKKVPHMLLLLDKLLGIPVIDDVVEVIRTCVGSR